MERTFRDRAEAGRALAARLAAYARYPDLLVIGLPRGGVPVAYEVARALHAPLDTLPVRKLGLPQQPELAMGAIALGGGLVLNQEVISACRVSGRAITAVVAKEQRELARRNALYRGGRPLPAVTGRCVIVVDDGLATGATMRAALASLRSQQPARLVVATPVGAPEICALLRTEADEVICLSMPPFLEAIGLWYADFPQVDDATVQTLLEQADHTPVEGRESYYA